MGVVIALRKHGAALECAANVGHWDIVFDEVLRLVYLPMFFFFSSRRRHTRSKRDWSSDVCSSDLRFVVASRWPNVVDDYTDPAPATTFGHLDATTNLSRAISELGIYPAVDPLASSSRDRKSVV